MKTNTLKIIRNELKETKRVLPQATPRPLNPAKFDEDPKHLIDFTNKGIKFLYSLIKMR